MSHIESASLRLSQGLSYLGKTLVPRSTMSTGPRALVVIRLPGPRILARDALRLHRWRRRHRRPAHQALREGVHQEDEDAADRRARDQVAGKARRGEAAPRGRAHEAHALRIDRRRDVLRRVLLSPSRTASTSRAQSAACASTWRCARYTTTSTSRCRCSRPVRASTSTTSTRSSTSAATRAFRGSTRRSPRGCPRTS